MKDRIIIVYQSKAKTGNTKHIAQQIAAQLKCEAVDIALNPKINLEQYNLVGFGSGIYFWNFGWKLKKWIKNIQWSSAEACKPEAFVFSTQGAKKANWIHARFNRFLEKKAGITVISGWACQATKAKTPEALSNLNEWLGTKIKLPDPNAVNKN
ncbi:MAG: hypothetical protein LBD63_00060 [Mycoplasmataceae bacterium]|nr:hypothetical protein [Mycoplasmataceae bacterium]